MDTDIIIKELQKYSETVCTLYPGINDDEIKGLEQKIRYELPKEFKNFISNINGFKLLSDILYGIHENNKSIDLFSNYIWEREYSNNQIWSYLLPIVPDGRGNHYCLDLKTIDSKKLKCNVVFWQHDYEYTLEDLPDIESSSFNEFIWEMLNEIGESINYDGTDK